VRALQKHVRFPDLYRAYCRNLGAQGGARVAELLTAAADLVNRPRYVLAEISAALAAAA
jgi:hypothetical protein